MVSIGETLRQARIDKGVSLAEAEQATLIRRRYLDALESDDFASLPAQVYTRGFIRTYAAYLGLNPQAILDLHQPPRTQEFGTRIRPTTPRLSRPSELPAGAMLVIGGAVVAMALMLLVYLRAQYVSFSDSLRSAESTQVPSTPGQSTVSLALGASQTRTAVALDPTPEPTSAPVTPTAIEGVLVLAKIDDNTWLEAWVDGERELGESVAAGGEKEFHGSQSVRLRVGNAAAVSVVVNGETQPPLGTEGQVVEATWGR